MPNLSVIVPVFNKEKHIVQAIDRLESTLKKAKIDYEIIVVDDGSTDNTRRKLHERKKKSPKRMKVLRMKNNAGKGFAIREGFKIARSESIAFIDGDLDIPSFQLPEFYKHLIDLNADGVVGSKRQPGTRIEWSVYRSFLSAGFICLVRFLFPWLSVKDTQVGIKIFRRKVLTQAFPVMRVDHWTFDLELLLYLLKGGYRLVEHPVEIYQASTDTNLKRISVLRMGIEILILFYRWYISRYYQKNSKTIGNPTNEPFESSTPAV